MTISLARAVLVSHWSVDQEAAWQLTVHAINGLRDGKVGRAEAIRLAMKRLFDSSLTREAHPSFWAPFVLIGEGSRRLRER